MPSIFVWKNNSACNDLYATIHSGSDWFLEEHAGTSYSYVTNNQLVINNNSQDILIYQVTKMPLNWVGSYCLESVSVPYKIHKQDDYGQLDQLGIWMRFISKNEIVFEKESLSSEMKLINIWINDMKK